MIVKEALAVLTKPFPDNELSVKVQSLSKNKDKAMLCLYISHTDVAKRLDEVDPGWMFETKFIGTVSSDAVTVEGALTVCGVKRVGVGCGDDAKSAYSDALKRAAVLFGVGRHLYDQENAWVPYNEQTDRYRVFTIEEYRAALGKRFQAAPQKPQEPQSVATATTTGTGYYQSKPGATKPAPTYVGDPGDYKVPFGREKGMMIRQLTDQQVEANIDYWSQRNKGEPLTGMPKTYLEALMAFRDQASGDDKLL